MINLSYGRIDDSFFDMKKLKKYVDKVSKNIILTSYVGPGGSAETKQAIADYASVILGSKLKVATSVSTNLSLFICTELFSNQLHVFTPIFLNYFHQFKRIKDKNIIEHEYKELLDNRVDYSNIKSGDLFIFILPNNPTGELPDRNILFDILKKLDDKGATVLLDLSGIESIGNEKYKDNFMEECLNFKNCIILLGFTKITGLSGIRCSGVIARDNIIDRFVPRHDELVISCGAFDEKLLRCVLKEGTPLNWKVVNAHVYNNYLTLLSMLKKSKVDYLTREYRAGIFAYFYLLNSPISSSIIAENCKRDNLLIYPSSFFENNDNGFRVSLGCDSKSFIDGINILLENIAKSVHK